MAAAGLASCASSACPLCSLPNAGVRGDFYVPIQPVDLALERVDRRHGSPRVQADPLIKPPKLYGLLESVYLLINSLELCLELVEAALAYYADSYVSVVGCQLESVRCPSLNAGYRPRPPHSISGSRQTSPSTPGG